jgi:glycine/D-amino acid oxidase-like deaminating enzyme
MRHVWIRRRQDGVTELTPGLVPLGVDDRWLVIFTAVIAACGFFLTGVMPAPVLGAVVAASLAGEVVLGAKAVVLVLLRPPAEVLEVPRFGSRRRSGGR